MESAKQPEPSPNPNSNRKKKKNERPEANFRRSLDLCSRSGDLAGALALYLSADSDGIHLSPYHFNTLLHIISSSLDTLETSARLEAIDTSFAVFDRMIASGAAPTEATITSMARIAAQKPVEGPELAFDLVKTMGDRYGIVPKLRTYGPALFGFCKKLDADKAFAVEAHMVSMRVSLDETEIAALLEVSGKEGREEMVYEYLHKLRRFVGCVTVATGDVLESWFSSERAAEAGKENWDAGGVKDAISMNGGGWHGKGWLGKGPWEVRRGSFTVEGFCSCCGERLACVDIDQKETEKFSESVAALAMEREQVSNFKTFQEWLENHTEYEAVIDGANIGFYQQNFAEGGFSLSQLNVVVKELYERSGGKWPLIILHKKRVQALRENPSDWELIETWISKGALYTTPCGSNDDWYWIYAALKLKCLLVTNDEMRDHIFELLGRDFFPKWKERHQVRYTFVKRNLVLHMPPPYSVVIQESETGSWHVPLDEKSSSGVKIWLCITRPGSYKGSSDAAAITLPGTTLRSCQGSAVPGVITDWNQTSGNLHEMQSASAKDVNGVGEIISPPMLSNDKSMSINGKRKTQSPSFTDRRDD